MCVLYAPNNLKIVSLQPIYTKILTTLKRNKKCQKALEEYRKLLDL